MNYFYWVKKPYFDGEIMKTQKKSGMNIEYYTVDVFTDKPFGGNQLAVIPDARGISGSLMQKIAKEFNFSETTFVLPPDNPQNDCRFRIFTPGMEIPTAGHPTVGTVYVLLNHTGIYPKHEQYMMVEQKIGDIKVTFRKESGKHKQITMSQPLPVFGEINENYNRIAEILSLSHSDIVQNYPMQAVSCGNNFLFIPLRSLEAIKKIRVRTDLLDYYSDQHSTTELYVFTMETENPSSTTHGRMFAPLFDIPEDPATGSASGPLGCYLVKYGLSDGQKIICEQGFEIDRPGIINVQVEHAADKITKVLVGGNAVLISKGEMILP